MWLIDSLAESHIQEALAKGELSNLPGEGKPLKLEDDSLVPPELRAGYRLLKNAGFLPPEMQTRREIADVQALIQSATTAEQKEQGVKRLNLLLMKLSQQRGDENLLLDQSYQKQIISVFNNNEGKT